MNNIDKSVFHKRLSELAGINIDEYELISKGCIGYDTDVLILDDSFSVNDRLFRYNHLLVDSNNHILLCDTSNNNEWFVVYEIGRKDGAIICYDYRKQPFTNGYKTIRIKKIYINGI